MAALNSSHTPLSPMNNGNSDSPCPAGDKSHTEGHPSQPGTRGESRQKVGEKDRHSSSRQRQMDEHSL